MSHNNSIKDLMKIKDINIKFDKGFCTTENIKGVNTTVIHATLEYDPDYCPKCACINNGSVIRYGTKTSNIVIPRAFEYEAILKLRKQRFLCKHCNSTFVASTDIVDPNCFISKSTKLAIAVAAKDKISEKDIAKRYCVSSNTVQRVFKSFYNSFKPDFNYLPKNLCFDEFKSVKEADGAMSFIFCDSTNSEIVDIVENRQLSYLEDYFSRYSIKARNSVKSIVIDMYSPYMSLIENLFPKSKIIIDKFHIVQLINRELNRTRIRIMNSFKKTIFPNYSKLKKYWKMFLIDSNKIKYTDRTYNKRFQKYVNSQEILDYMLGFSEELEETYSVYQNLLYAIKTKNLALFNKIIYSKNKNISIEMKKAISTLKKYYRYIKNTFRSNFTNGRIEGINNKIKTIKRIAFGYRSFENFKTRILISNNLIKIKAA